MIYIFTIIAIIVIPFFTIFANSFIDLAGEIKTVLPGGWQLSKDSNDYPFQIINEEQTAELLIFKSIITEDEAITSETELKISVDKVIDDVILTLPEAKLLTNTGYFNQNRVWFTLEFLSFDTVNVLELQHRLNGVLYRHPDGYQLLFTLWAKGTKDVFSTQKNDLMLMQDSFTYYGAAESNIFNSSDLNNWYWWALLFLIVTMIYYLFKRGRKYNRTGSFRESHFWRCECGRLNHNQNHICQRCGKTSQAGTIS